MIKVEYDGTYPTTCMGTLRIYEDGKLIYSKKFCCYSTGSVRIDNEWREHVKEGELRWGDDAKEFRKEIREAVKQKLSECCVCCGGCV